jgi:lipopolysaccharide/colanic/teichoic acid biosynthesis glycosyltransferase
MTWNSSSALLRTAPENAPVDAGVLRPASSDSPRILLWRARALKRAIDIAAALALAILGAPLCVLVAIAIRLEDGGPVLFRQIRVGRGGAAFTLYKLRSMRRDAEVDSGPQWAAPGDARVTRIGRWIRSLRIDEIPQAWNILAGHMSFVGPRPERPEFVAVLRRAIAGYDERHQVRPGLTGWAQVNQPYSGTIEDARRKLDYDLEYLRMWSPGFDAHIMVRTATILAFGWNRSEPQVG